MPNPWVSLRRDQHIPVKKAINKKEQLEKGLEEEEKKSQQLHQRPVCKMFIPLTLSESFIGAANSL
jgi:hypothetical protein